MIQSTFSFIALSLFVPLFLLAQVEQGIIYGTIKLKNGAQYEGQIRWQKEEAFWDDIFDASKHERPAQNLLTKAEINKIESRDGEFTLGFMSLWEDKSPKQKFPFRCHFGNIQRMKTVSDQIVLLTLKNGESIELAMDGRGDLHENIVIYDKTVGKLELQFEKIQSIQFQPTPEGFVSPLGAPVYGKILTTMGLYEGYITWDMEECLGKDLISGWNKGVLIDINFEDIVKLKAQEDGSLITLKSGRTIFLNNHHDVSKRNRGIMIRNLSFGKLTVRWKNFISAAFTTPEVPPRTYHEFAAPSLLRGSVYTRTGYCYRGQIVYDLDEIYDLEFLNGKNNDFDYAIPFSKIVKIEPQNDMFSMVHLNDGQQFLLGEEADVAAGNHGIVMRMTGSKPEYIEWKDVKYIDFEK